MRTRSAQNELARQQGVVDEYAGHLIFGAGAAFVLTPLRCGVLDCGCVAVLIDSFAPFFTEQNRCVEHAPQAKTPATQVPGKEGT